MRRLRTRAAFVAFFVLLFFLASGFCFEHNGERYCVWAGNCYHIPRSGGGGGGGGNPQPTPTRTPTPGPTPTPTASIYQTYGTEYSYGATCQDGTEIDPITTVLRTRQQSEPEALAILQDRWIEIGLDHGPGQWTGLQHFRDHFGCVEGEVSQAENSGSTTCFPQVICASERWHVRCNVVSLADLSGFWASCTPHWDSSDGSPIDQCGHWVPAVYNGKEDFEGSGFDAGKDWLWHKLVAEYGLPWEGARYWDNRRMMWQCTGAEGEPELSGSNGWVNQIRVEH